MYATKRLLKREKASRPLTLAEAAVRDYRRSRWARPFVMALGPGGARLPEPAGAKS